MKYRLAAIAALALAPVVVQAQYGQPSPQPPPPQNQPQQAKPKAEAVEQAKPNDPIPQQAEPRREDTPQQKAEPARTTGRARGERRAQPPASEVQGDTDRVRMESRGRVVTARTASARGRSSARRGMWGLTHDQMHELQQKLSEEGCYTGSVDGIAGPATRQAVACARGKKGITGQNMNDLFRALDLDFGGQAVTISEVMSREVPR